MKDIYKDGLLDLRKKYIDLYQENQNVFMYLLSKLDGPLKIMLTLYEMGVREKNIIPIEHIPKEEKEKLWNQAKEDNDKERAIKICKCLWLIQEITK